MKKVFTFLILPFLFFFTISTTITAQTFDGDWSTALITNDDNVNGTNQRTMAVAATTGDNNFVALVSRPSADEYYLVGYKNATDSTGRLGASFSSGDDPPKTFWINGFDQVEMDKAYDIASQGDLIFVASNDAAYNILVFEIREDSVYTHPKRLSTATNPFAVDSLWAIHVDDAGRVYVTTQGNESEPSKVFIYDSNDPEWSSGHSAEPKQTITLPDNGLAEGVTTNSDGTILYVSNKDNGKIHAYTGNITDGYTLAPSFSYERLDYVDSANVAGPLNLSFLDENNILFVAVDNDLFEINSYWFGRMYALNPNSGEILDTIDVAKWNFDAAGQYANAVPGVASGYTSTFTVDFDDNKNLYTQSHYGWAIEKWTYSGTLPTIELTIVGVEKLESQIPNSFKVSQNYPNPFNPSTTIEFSVTERAPITLSIYNIKGELITNLVNGAEFEAGIYKVTFDASRLASGTYIYSISNGGNVISKKMTLLK
ncbi:MAG: T9SS type A sorting domain-containing protein [Bacteroidota bacterium]